MSLNSSPVVEYEYDSSSRLLQRVEGGTTTNYIWDGWDLVREEKTGAVTETTEYLCPEGEVLAFKRGGDWYYLHGDALSSTQLVTDESGAVVGRYVYGAWGEELVASESVPGLFENRFVGGLGCRRDSATGLVYMRHRWYDCQLQRFISRDPIGLMGGWNSYAYVENDPVGSIDLIGQKRYKVLVELVGKCKRAFKKLTLSEDEIAKQLRNGKNLTRADKRLSRKKMEEISKNAWGDTVYHEPHGGLSTNPHFQPAKRGRGENQQQGHFNLSVGAPVLLGAGFGEAMFGDNAIGDTVDFFNPMDGMQEALDLAASAWNGFTSPFIRFGNWLRGKQRERSGCE